MNQQVKQNPISMPWSAIAGGLGAIGSIAGGVISASAMKQAAQAQLQATRETNESNQKLAQAQRDFEYRMVQEQNEYNSLAQQRARAEEAGYSPYILGGSNSSLQSQIPQYNPIPNQVPNYELQSRAAEQLGSIPSDAVASFLNGANGFATVENAGKIGAERQAIEIENQTRLAEALARIDKIYKETKNEEVKTRLNELQEDILGANKKALSIREGLTNELIAQQASESFAKEMYQRSLVSLNSVHIKWLDQEKRMSLAESASRIALNSAQRGLSLAQTKLAISNAVLSELAATGMRLDFDSKRIANAYAGMLNQATYDELRARVRSLNEQTDWLPYDKTLNGISTVGKFYKDVRPEGNSLVPLLQLLR